MRHYVLGPATRRATCSDAWSRVGFGQQHAHGIREVPDARLAGGRAPRRGARRRRAGRARPRLSADHQAQSPVFAPASPPTETPDELRAEILEDLAKPEVGELVAERDGRVVGCVRARPGRAVRASTRGSPGPRRRAARLGGDASPRCAASGAGLALTEAAFAWARERGHEVMVTDWRVTNLLSSRFWPQRGFRETFLRLYRHIP